MVGSAKEQAQEEKVRFEKDIEAMLVQKKQPQPGNIKLRKTKSTDDNKKQ